MIRQNGSQLVSALSRGGNALTTRSLATRSAGARHPLGVSNVVGRIDRSLLSFSWNPNVRLWPLADVATATAKRRITVARARCRLFGGGTVAQGLNNAKKRASSAHENFAHADRAIE
jgi:hypothetical protein